MKPDDDPADGEKHHDAPAEPHYNAEVARELAAELIDVAIFMTRPENRAWVIQDAPFRPPARRRKPSARGNPHSA